MPPHAFRGFLRHTLEREASATVALDGSTRRECPTCGGAMPRDREVALFGAEEAARGFINRKVVLDPKHSTVPESLADVLRAEESEALVGVLAAAFLSRDAAVREARDRLWCAAIIPEGSRVIQSATTRVNDPAFVAEVEDFRRGVRP